MVYRAQFANFVADKRDFFAHVNSFRGARKRANDQKHNYGFVGGNEMLIRSEFKLLFDKLAQENDYPDVFWFYCYYCSVMLYNYHRAYGQKAKMKEFSDLRSKIRTRCLTGKLPSDKQTKETFLAYLAEMIAAGLVDWATTPTSVAKIRDKVAFANISRIYWFFCRTMITKSFLLARDIQLIDRIGSVLGKKIDVDAIIQTLEKPNAVLRFLSVGFFATRFIINAGMIIKHVFFPSAEESKLTWYKRLGNEVYKRHAEILNDVVWGTVNLFTNYNEIFHIAAPTAGWIVAGFLFFDFCLIVWRRFLAEREYEIKRAQLCSDRHHYNVLLKQQNDPQRLIYERQYRLLTEEIKQLELSWKATSETFWFNATAALLLMTGFSASMIFSPAIIVLACYALCTFAVAMYLSDSAYNKYKEKSLLLDDARFEQVNYDKYLAEYREARNEFYLTLAKNFIMPALVITIYAICWQAALTFTILYFAYKLYESANNHAAKLESQKNDNAEKPLLNNDLKNDVIRDLTVGPTYKGHSYSF